MNLSDVFTAVAHKELVAVDLPNAGSNQHEINGNKALQTLFGTTGESAGSIEWRFFADDTETHRGSGTFTFYQSRKPPRS
jgi:hypothetical protein